MLLGVEMAAGMRRYPYPLYARSVSLYNVFYGTIGQLPPVIGKEVIIIGVFQGEVLFCCPLIFQHSLSQNGRNWYNPLLMVLSVDDNEIIVYILLLDTT